MQQEDGSVIVDLPGLGKVKGNRSSNSYWSKKPIYQFRSIKYGESPTGQNRFKAPVAAKPWTNIRDATSARPFSVNDQNIQKFLKERANDDIEDCLYLSIYSNNLSGNAPIICFIPSSGFFEDNGEHLPNFLLDFEIVLVIPTYRTGVLGFLSTQTADIPGNAGIEDVHLALEWVQKNAEHFGGNPKSVTVAGHAFGAAIANYLCLEDRAYIPDLDDKELPFQRVIYQSGSLLGPWAVQQNPLAHARKVAGACGYSRNAKIGSTDEMNKFFIESDIKELLLELFDDKYQCRDFDPCSYGLSKICLERQNTAQIVVRKIPTMAGVTKHDGTFPFAKAYNILCNRMSIDYPPHNQFLMLQTICGFLDIEDSSGLIANLASAQIFEQKDLLEGDFGKLIDGLVDFCGTIMYKVPTFRAAQLNAMYNDPEQTYLYTFDYSGDQTENAFSKSALNLLTSADELPSKGGVFHSYELNFLLPSNEFLQTVTTEEAKIAKTICQLWTSFAKNAVPKADEAEKWEPLKKVTGPVLHINTKCTLTEDFIAEFSVASKEGRHGHSLRKPCVYDN